MTVTKGNIKKDKKIKDDLFYLGTAISGSAGLGVIIYILLKAKGTTGNMLVINPNSIGELNFEIVLCISLLLFIVFSFSRYLFIRIKNHK